MPMGMVSLGKSGNEGTVKDNRNSKNHPMKCLEQQIGSSATKEQAVRMVKRKIPRVGHVLQKDTVAQVAEVPVATITT